MSKRLSYVFCENVQRLMALKNINQRDLAKISGLTQGAISHLLTGERRTPTLETVEYIAMALGVPPIYLLIEDSTKGIPFTGSDDYQFVAGACRSMEALQMRQIFNKRAKEIDRFIMMGNPNPVFGNHPKYM